MPDIEPLPVPVARPSAAPADAPTSAVAPPTRRGAFVLLFFCLMTSGIGNSILFAVLPPMVREIGMADIAVGAIYTISALLFTLCSQYWGTVSDQIGRRPVILIGLVGYALSMLAFATAVAGALAGWFGLMTTFLTLAISRAAFGMIGSAAGPAAQAYVADRTRPDQRTAALARMTSAFALGAALGPAIAAGLAPFTGYVMPLVLVAGAALAGAVAVHLLVPENRPPRPQSGSRGGMAQRLMLALDPRVRMILVIGVVSWVIQGGALQTVNFHIMDALGIAARDALPLAGIVLTLGALAGIAAQMGVVPLARLAPRTAMVAGLVVTALGMAVLMVSAQLGVIALGFCLASFGMGLTRPGMTAAASLAVTPEEQGGAAGVAAATAGVGFVLAPFTGLGLRALAGTSAPYALAVALALAALVLAFLHPRIRAASDRARTGFSG